MTFHYENKPMQYTEILRVVKKEDLQQKFFDIFRIFAQSEAVLTCTHNLCFGTKIRKIGIPLHTPVLLCKSGV